MSKPTLKSIILIPVNRGFEIILTAGNAQQEIQTDTIYIFDELDLLIANVKNALHADMEEKKKIIDIQRRLQSEPEAMQ